MIKAVALATTDAIANNAQQQPMKIKNFTSFDTNDVEILSYDDFYHNILSLVELEDNHCISLFARPLSKRSLRLWAFVACDATADISVFVADINADTSLNSLTAECPAFHPFEREIYEHTARHLRLPFLRH